MESFQERVTAEWGFEAQIEVRQADDEGKVFRVKGPADLKV